MCSPILIPTHRVSAADAADDEFWQLLPMHNLSYAKESYLDNYSTSANFVFNPSISASAPSSGKHLTTYLETYSRNGDISLQKTGASAMTEMGDSAAVDMAAENLKELAISEPSYERQMSTSDTIDSEEGVFLNMLDDDMDSQESETLNARSICSDDFSVDSINSPDEDDLENGHCSLEEQLNEAVNVAMAKSAVREEREPEKAEQPRKLEPFNFKIAINDVPLAETTSERSIYDIITSDSPIFEDREFNFTKAELRKSTSLKTYKTPPGTPSRKKVVRFADALGLDLESVRHILNLDSPPKIPASAMKDLQVGLGEERKFQGSVYLAVTFPQPGVSHTFVQKVLSQKVCLENALVNDLTITGFIRVANCGFHKVVRVRYSINNWESFYDIAASYCQNSCDGPTDRFSFSLVAPPSFSVGSKLQFAISYKVNNQSFWDSNFGQNYVFECYAKTIPTENDNSWMHFL